jgi:tungstate ABC transporter binding protein WtpA
MLNYNVSDRTMNKISDHAFIVVIIVLIVAGAGFAGCTSTSPTTPHINPPATVSTAQPVSTPVATPIVTAVPATSAAEKKQLIVFNAGSLTNSFSRLAIVYEKDHPDTGVRIYSGTGSAIIDNITNNAEKADILAVDDGMLIEKQMFPNYADYYVKFAKNSMVLMYTNQSAHADEITSDNWYVVLMYDGVRLVTGDPNTDPGGYRAYQTIKLSERFYGRSNIFNLIIGSHSKITTTSVDGVYVIDVTNPDPDGKGLIIASTGQKPVDILKAGNADYYLGYMNTAWENNISYITLPVEMDLSDPTLADKYDTVAVKRILGNGTAIETGTPIEYGITVPTVAVNSPGGVQWIQLLLSSEGRAILAGNGLTPIVPPAGIGNVPVSLIPPVVKS